MGTSWIQLSEKLLMQAKEKRVPISGQFELTARCNLKCKMCYICKNSNDREAMGRERSAEEWIQLAKEAKAAGMLYLLLTGGEVFLHKDFRRIYDEVAVMGFNIKIFTNATMITQEIAKWLGRIPPSVVEVTLYGASPETYLRVCGHADGFERAVRGIELLIAEGISIRLKMTVIRDNTDDFIKIAEFAKKHGVELGYIDYVFPRREGFGTSPELERLSPQEVLEFETYVNSYYKEDNGTEMDKPRINKSKDQLNELDPISENKDTFSCMAGKCTFWVTWDGKMTICGDMSEPAVYPFEHGFFQAWKGLEGLCASIPMCGECRQCHLKEYCMYCPARLKIETGFYDKPAPYLCELARRRRNLEGGEIIENLHEAVT